MQAFFGGVLYTKKYFAQKRRAGSSKPELEIEIDCRMAAHGLRVSLKRKGKPSSVNFSISHMKSCKNQQLFIYADTGTSAPCISEWQTRFGQMNIKSKLVYADDIRTGVLNHADGLVIPGGADVEYCAELNGAGNTAIKDFVRKGGIYIGVCAGAYYAHSRINWQNCTEQIAGERELAFFNGTAEGPLIAPYSPLTNQGLTFVPIHYRGGTARVYYKGGPIMSVCERTRVTAYFMFKDKKYPAVIQRDIGKGLAVAVSPHIEYTDEYLQSIHAPRCPHRSGMFFDIMEDILKVSASKESR